LGTFSRFSRGCNLKLYAAMNKEIKLELSYLATPYSNYRAGLDEAYHDAILVVVDLTKQGLCVYSPIVHLHPVARAGNIDPLDAMWMALDEPFMHAADSMIIAMLPGWKESQGVRKEIEYFQTIGKPIRYYDPQERLFE
jgi:hypothetical protein